MSNIKAHGSLLAGRLGRTEDGKPQIREAEIKYTVTAMLKVLPTGWRKMSSVHKAM